MPVRRPPAALQLRRRHHAEHDLVVDDQRDQRRPDRHAADEVLGAVDRVDHPAPLAVPGRALLLAGDRVAGAHPRQRAPDALLDRLVGVGHRRQVRLAHHVQVERLEPALGERVGVVGEHVGEAQVVGVVRGGRHGAHPIHFERSASWSVYQCMEINGLPLHPLVVHAAVIFGPLAALAALVYAVVPRWRDRLRWPMVALALVAGGVDRRGVPHRQQLPGQQARARAARRCRPTRTGPVTLWVTLGFGAVALAAGCLARAPGRAPGRCSTRCWPSPRWRRWCWWS